VYTEYRNWISSSYIPSSNITNKLERSQSVYSWCGGGGRGVRLWWRCGRVAAGVVGVWALQQDVSRTGGSGGSGDGPRVRTGIVTPHHSSLPPTHHRRQQIPAAPPFSRHNSSARSTTTYPTIPLSPRRKLISSLCTRIHIHTHMLA